MKIKRTNHRTSPQRQPVIAPTAEGPRWKLNTAGCNRKKKKLNACAIHLICFCCSCRNRTMQEGNTPGKKWPAPLAMKVSHPYNAMHALFCNSQFSTSVTMCILYLYYICFFSLLFIPFMLFAFVLFHSIHIVPYYVYTLFDFDFSHTHAHLLSEHIKRAST